MSTNAFMARNDGDPPGSGTADEALRRRLSALPGLDVALGLSHLRGRHDSYARVLKKFAETRAADIEATNSHLAARNHAELAALMHNLKGIAGFLGAVELQETATALCAAMRAGQDDGEVERLTRAIVKMQSELSAGVLAAFDQPPEKSGS